MFCFFSTKDVNPCSLTPPHSTSTIKLLNIAIICEVVFSRPQPEKNTLAWKGIETKIAAFYSEDTKEPFWTTCFFPYIGAG